MAGKKSVAPKPFAPSLFGEESIEEITKSAIRSVKEDAVVVMVKKNYNWRDIGINADYEKNGRITLFNNKLP